MPVFIIHIARTKGSAIVRYLPLQQDRRKTWPSTTPRNSVASTASGFWVDCCGITTAMRRKYSAVYVLTAELLLHCESGVSS